MKGTTKPIVRTGGTGFEPVTSSLSIRPYALLLLALRAVYYGISPATMPL